MRAGAHLFSVLLVFIFYAMVGVSFAQTTSYTYDDLNRLIKAEYGDGTVIEYTYDEVGNRVSKKVTTMAPAVTIAVAPRPCHIPCEPCPIPWGHSDNYNGVVVPIDVSDIKGLGITSVSLTVTYDDSILTATGASATGTISPNHCI